MSQRQPLDEVTAREREVLDLVRLGLTNEEIAARLGITEAGVKYHVSQILSKLGVTAREQAAAYATTTHVAEAFQPRRRPRWWAALPLAAKAAGASLVLAAVAGLGLLAWGVLRTSEQSADASEIVAQASAAMSTASFSYKVEDCPLCDDQPVLTEYAPPDRIELSGSNGHDDWPHYLVIGRARYLSNDGIRWLVGYDHNAFFMVLTDPRVLLRYASEPRLTGNETIDGKRHQVVSSGINIESLIQSFAEDELPDDNSAAITEFQRDFGATKVRFWIDIESFLVRRLEIDYPRLSFLSEPEDPPPGIVEFDFETAVDVPLQPLSMSYEEAQRLWRSADPYPIINALKEYKAINGVYPPAVTPGVLGDLLPAAAWPVNPFSGQPMRQVLDNSPGDFRYELRNQGRDYYISFFGWDAAYLTQDTTRGLGGE